MSCSHIYLSTDIHLCPVYCSLQIKVQSILSRAFVFASEFWRKEYWHTLHEIQQIHQSLEHLVNRW